MYYRSVFADSREFAIMEISMAHKKRKTRDQKERAAQRQRKQSSIHSEEATRPQISSTETKPETYPDQGSAGQGIRYAERIRLMQVSLIVFGALVGVQLLLWSLEYMGVVSLSVM